MGKKIFINYYKPVNSHIENLKKFIQSEKGFFEGNDASGSLYLKSKIGTFKGKYTVTKNQIIIEIEKKPFLISYDRIQFELNKYLGNK